MQVYVDVSMLWNINIINHFYQLSNTKQNTMYVIDYNRFDKCIILKLYNSIY